MNQIEPSEDHDVVRAVESLALVAVGEHGDRAVVLGAGDAPVAVLAGDQAALRSRVLPLVKPDGSRNTPTAPVISSQRNIRSFGMSLQTR